MRPDGHSSRPVSASSQPRWVRGPRLAGAWRVADEAFRTGRNRLEPTVAGQVCKQLGELGFINSSLQFAAVFTLGFIPFLMMLSVALGSDLSRAVVIRSGSSAKAGHDVASLFTHGRTAPATLSMLGLVLRPNLIGLDTGCVWGGKLTALCLEDRSLVQIDCPQHRKPG